MSTDPGAEGNCVGAPDHRARQPYNTHSGTLQTLKTVVGTNV